MAKFFKHDDFEFMMDLALGAVYHRGADVGECLVVADRIDDGDAESWFVEWTAIAERIRDEAGTSESAGHRVSAADAYLRAAAYYDTATFFVDQTEDPERFLPTWKRHRACWDRFAALSEPPIESVRIPYAGTELPGYLFRVDESGQRRPLLILNNGSDGPVSAMWLQGAAGGLRRGYNCLTFDGPGQGAALWLRGLHFRPDWEAVIGPVVDFALDLPEVDAQQIALLGVSQAGYWVPRAVAFEKRIAAAIADPGVWDVATSWTAHLPKSLQKQLEVGERDKFNKSFDLGLRFRRSMRGTLAFRMRPYGLETPYDVYHALQDYTLDGVAERITCPILITDPDAEQFWPGQAEKLYRAVASERKSLVRFTAAEGAEGHCEPKALGLRDQRIFDWLDQVLETGP